MAPAGARAACPADFAGLDCDGTGVNLVCQVSGGGYTVTCDLGKDGDTAGSDAKFVSPSSTTFRAYGLKGDGEGFCCELTVAECDNPITVNITGTYEVDIIDLNDSIEELSLDCSTASVYGEDQNDNISGSNLTTNFDYLYGDQDADTINGLGGDDHIYGGTGNDLLYGGANADIINGEGNDDHCEGGAGNDSIEGGSGIDELDGGDGDDTLNGGSGDDELCGRWGADSLYGGDDNDWVFGGPNADVINKGDGGTNDYCENDASDGATCEWPLATYCPF